MKALILISACLWATLAQAKVDTANLKLTTIDGKSSTLNDYKGKVLLIVNTASACGYTPQYKGLQELQDKYSAQGLVVLGFPSNDFGGQEPGSNQEIKKFCSTKYRIKFPMFAKAPVSGQEIQPLFTWLTQEAAPNLTGPVKWNFEKFILSRQGQLKKRFTSGVAPDSADLVQAIEAELASK